MAWERTEVTEVTSVTSVTDTSVDTLVSDTTSVVTVVSVAVAVDTAAVVTGSVTVNGCGFKQLHALESPEAGRRRKLRLFNVGQLGAELVVRFTTTAPVTVVVTVACSTSVAVKVAVVSVVVILFRYVNTLRSNGRQLTYITSVAVVAVVEVSVVISCTTGVDVLR